MANTNEVVLVGDVSGIQGSISDVATRIRDRMHARSFEIGRTLVALVQDKTPVLTGALQFSSSYADSLTGDDLVWIYADDAPQEDARSTSVVKGKGVDLGGGRSIKNKQKSSTRARSDRRPTETLDRF